MQAYLINLDTVNVVSTMDTINSSGSYVGGSKTVSITSGENAIGTFGHVNGSYTNTTATKSTSTSGTGTKSGTSTTAPTSTAPTSSTTSGSGSDTDNI